MTPEQRTTLGRLAFARLRDLHPLAGSSPAAYARAVIKRTGPSLDQLLTPGALHLRYGICLLTHCGQSHLQPYCLVVCSVEITAAVLMYHSR